METLIITVAVTASVYFIIHVFKKQVRDEQGCTCGQNCKACSHAEKHHG